MSEPGGLRHPPPAIRQEGLRERKKRRTKRAIQEIALDLFEKQGFDATTVDQIAAAAEISPSTFFNYFPSKEDVVAFDETDPILFEFLASRPPDEPPLEKARRMMLDAAVPLMEQDRELVLKRARIAFGVPSLQARLWQETEEGLNQFGKMLAASDGDPDHFELRVVVRVIESVALESLLEWARSDGKANLRRLLERAFDVAAAGLQTPKGESVRTTAPKTSR